MRFIYTKTFAIFFACLVLLAALVFMQTKGWLDPVRKAALYAPRPLAKAINAVTLPVKVFLSTIYQLKNITKENIELSGTVFALQQQLVLFNEQARENEALRKELGFAKNSKQQLVPCSVLSNNPFGLSEGLILNCGSQTGVSAGQAVISQGFLVGKIIYAGKSDSTALLLTSSSFSTDARVSQSNQPAIVRGSYGSGAILDQVPQNAALPKGSLIVTAGINEKIPKNILIGEVSQVLSSGNDLFKKAAVSSPIDFNNLQFVFVVK